MKFRLELHLHSRPRGLAGVRCGAACAWPHLTPLRCYRLINMWRCTRNLLAMGSDGSFFFTSVFSVLVIIILYVIYIASLIVSTLQYIIYVQHIVNVGHKYTPRWMHNVIEHLKEGVTPVFPWYNNFLPRSGVTLLPAAL